MAFLKNYRYELLLLVVIAGTLIVSYFVKDKIGIFGDVEAFRDYVAGFGAWAPIVVVVLTTLEVVIAPLPGGVPAVASGFLFGILGIIYAVAGNILGSSLAFLIARTLGKKVVERFIEDEKLSRFQDMIHRRQKVIWALYFLPLAPLDVITFAVGLSSIRFLKFFIISSIGLTVSMSLYVILGDYLARVVF